MLYYVGKLDKGYNRSVHVNRALIFKSKTDVDDDHTINGIAICFGGYKTRKKAEEVAMYQGYHIVNKRTSHIPELHEDFEDVDDLFEAALHGRKEFVN